MTSEQRLEENPTCEGKDSSSMWGRGVLAAQAGGCGCAGRPGPTCLSLLTSFMFLNSGACFLVYEMTQI